MAIENRGQRINRDKTATRIGRRRYLSDRVLPTLGMFCLFAAVVAGFVLASNVLLLGFAGVLLAVLLHAISALTQRLLGLRYGWSLTIVLTILAAALAAGGWFLASEAIQQFRELQTTLSVDQIRTSLAQYPWASNLADSLSLEEALSQRRLVSGVTGAFSTALGAMANVVIVLFVGVYLAVNPRLYRDGFLQLIPPARRETFARLLAKLRSTLSWWLVGRIVNMTIVGVATAIGLMLLGAPLPIALGLIAFFFDFVPYIGPILSVIPAFLVSLSQGTDLALYVVALYIGVQSVESYLLTPMIQQRAVRLPPALTILWQVLLGVLFGVLGIMLATPLLAVLMVSVKTLYLKQDA
jgi:predicted PurR-regulated permease PerM